MNILHIVYLFNSCRNLSCFYILYGCYEKMVLWTFMLKFLRENIFSVLLGMALLGHMEIYVELFKESQSCFSQWLHYITFLSTVYKGSCFSTSLLMHVIICCFDYIHTIVEKWNLSVILICVSIMTMITLCVCIDYF